MSEQERLRAALKRLHGLYFDVERGDHRAGDHPDTCDFCAALAATEAPPPLDVERLIDALKYAQAAGAFDGDWEYARAAAVMLDRLTRLRSRFPLAATEAPPPLDVERLARALADRYDMEPSLTDRFPDDWTVDAEAVCAALQAEPKP